VLSTAQRIESVEYAEIVQSVDIEELGGCRTSVGKIDRVADRENFFFRVIVALDTPSVYSHFHLIARGKRQVVTNLAAKRLFVWDFGRFTYEIEIIQIHSYNIVNPIAFGGKKNGQKILRGHYFSDYFYDQISWNRFARVSSSEVEGILSN
jgi:hypothetical protein